MGDDASRHLRASQLFTEVCSLSLVEQEALLARVAAEDPALVAEIRDLLGHDAPDDSAFDEGRFEALFAAKEAIELDPQTDGQQRIGDYLLIDLLGEGGMGTVYRARQERTERDVALKVLRAGLGTPTLRRRFERETRVLGRLEHPGIARIYDAGIDGAGASSKPWFAMELVDGAPLTAYAERERLSTSERLELLARTAEAVEHAHERGVVHRDLKPSNVLVSGMQPRVLDFGVALLVEPDKDGAATAFTEAGQVVGTLPYMSPEQVSGLPGAIDARTDVYALGVIAYELLSGTLPIDVRRRSLADAARLIEEVEPDLLGRRDPAFRGDVERIVEKALSKEPARRYASAGALAADLRRHMRHDPIEACPPSFTDQISRLTRRHRAVATSLVAILVVLTAASVVSVAFALRSRDAERDANERSRALDRANESLLVARAQAVDEAARATAVNEFLRRIMDAADPFSRDRGAEMTLADVLESAEHWVGRTFVDRPAAEAAARVAIASSEKGLAHFDKAEDQLTAALAALGRVAGPPRLKETLEIRRALAVIAAHRGRASEAEAVLRDVLAEQTKTGQDLVEIAKTRSDLAWVLRAESKFEEALVHARDADLTFRSELGDDDEQVANNGSTLASILIGLGETRGAKEALESALASQERRFGPDHPVVALLLNNLARVAQLEGDEATAAKRYQEAIERMDLSLDEPHPRLADLWNNLGSALNALSRYDEAQAAFERALQLYAATVGEDGRDYMTTLNNLAYLLWDAGHLEEAGARFLTYERWLCQHDGPDHWRTFVTMGNRARCLDEAGRRDEAEPLLHAAVDGLMGQDGGVPPTTISTVRAYVKMLDELGRTEDAARLRTRVPGIDA